MKPYWPAEPTTASDSEEAGGAERLRVETKVNVELHQENKLNHIAESLQDKDSSSKEGGTVNQTNSNHQPEQRKGKGMNISVLYSFIKYKWWTKKLRKSTFIPLQMLLLHKGTY